MNSISRLWLKLRNPKYRKAFVGSHLKRSVPFQIEVLRKARKWSQQRLAVESGLTQGVISRAEDQEYGNLTLNTIIQIAGGLDRAFIGKFVTFAEAEKYYADLSEDSIAYIPSFDEEDRAMKELPPVPRETLSEGLRKKLTGSSQQPSELAELTNPTQQTGAASVL